MILKCPTCTSKLSISIEKLRKAKSLKVTCGKCKGKFQIFPRKANCWNCKNEMEYHDFKLDPKKPLKQCSQCSAWNKMPVGKHTFKIHKPATIMTINCENCKTPYKFSKAKFEKVKGSSGAFPCKKPDCNHEVRFDFTQQETIISTSGNETIITSKNGSSSNRIMKGFLKVIENEKSSEQTFTIKSGTKTIGRFTEARKADIRIQTKDEYMSKIHCGIEVNDLPNGKKGFILSDKGSMNGTYFKNKKLESSEALYLNDGDTFRIGRTSIRFHIILE